MGCRPAALRRLPGADVPSGRVRPGAQKNRSAAWLRGPRCKACGPAGGVSPRRPAGRPNRRRTRSPARWIGSSGESHHENTLRNQARESTSIWRTGRASRPSAGSSRPNSSARPDLSLALRHHVQLRSHLRASGRLDLVRAGSSRRSCSTRWTTTSRARTGRTRTSLYAAGHKALGLYAMWALRNEIVRIGAPELLPQDDRMQLRLEDLLGFRRNPVNHDAALQRVRVPGARRAPDARDPVRPARHRRLGGGRGGVDRPRARRHGLLRRSRRRACTSSKARGE